MDDGHHEAAAPGDEPAAPEPADDDRDNAPGEPPDDDTERRPKDLGRDFSGRAAQPGDTGERLGAERDARSSFRRATVRARHVIGGDQYNVYLGTTTTRVRFFTLPAEELDEARFAFVDPDGFPALAEAAKDRTVILLQGSAGSGRYAAARKLLVHASVPAMHRLDPATDLSQLSTSDLKPGGYILVVADGSSLSDFTLHRLDAELGDRRLIVIVPPDLRSRDAEIARYVLELGARPAPKTVLRAHLEWRLGDGATQRAGRLLAREDIRSLVERELDGECPLDEAARLARLLADAAEPEDKTAATVREQLVSPNRDDFEDWFENLQDLSTQCLATAIAVLGGEPYEAVNVAAAALQRRLEPPESPENTERSRSDPFRASRSSRLRALRAVLVRSSVPTRHGGAPGEVVRYRDPDVPQQVVLHLWREYDEVREPLLAWLRQYARHDVQTIRVRAAVVTGVLASQAFDHIHARIILPWARDRDARLRDAAATALSVAMAEPALKPLVRNLVGSWSTDSVDPKLQATAARAWRIELDAGDPSAAVTLLDGLGGSEHVIVKEAICDSISELIEIEDGAFAPDALGLLHRWVDGRKVERQLTGRLAFLLAAADLVRQVPASSEPERAATWPALLHIAARDPARQREIAAIWASVLNSADLHTAAKEILTEWARTAEREPVIRRSLAGLLAAAATTPRTGRIIRRLASTWATGDRRTPHSAGETVAALDEQGTFQ